MSLIVPFDTSDLSVAALVRARELGEFLDEDVIAVTVIPIRNTRYARKKGWIESGEEFDKGVIVPRLRKRVRALHPDAEFEAVDVAGGAAPGTIASNVRRIARDAGARMVIIGSDNAGRITNQVSIVGEAIADDDTYDVLIVRHVPDRIPD